MESCDVLIVGGGPAGSSCAWKLQQAGFDVLVMDKQPFPRDKTCAGWVTPAVVEVLQIDPDNYARSRVWQPITGFRTGLIGGDEVHTVYDEPVSYGIRRYEFDHYLLERAGVRTRLGEPVKTWRREGGGWIVNDRLRTKLIIGAGGHFCPIARFLGARRAPRASVVAAQEVEFHVARTELQRGRIAGDTPELFFCNDLAGYGWCFRKGDYLNIGLGRIDAQNLSSHVAAFCDFLRDQQKICCQLPTRFHGHAYQLYERTQPVLADQGVLLVGDAAGLAYPQSGEGIRPAVESGLMAAEVIVASAGRFGRDDLEIYQSRILARFGKPRSGGLADRLPAGWLRFCAARLMATRWFNRKIVLDRWFLHKDVPALS